MRSERERANERAGERDNKSLLSDYYSTNQNAPAQFCLVDRNGAIRLGDLLASFFSTALRQKATELKLSVRIDLERPPK